MSTIHVGFCTMKCAFIATFVNVCKKVNQVFFFFFSNLIPPPRPPYTIKSAGLICNSYCVIFFLFLS